MRQKDSWAHWSAKVLSDLERLDNHTTDIKKDMDLLTDKINERFNELQMDIVTLKTKSSVWGGAAGLVVGAVVSSIVSLLIKGQ